MCSSAISKTIKGTAVVRTGWLMDADASSNLKMIKKSGHRAHTECECEATCIRFWIHLVKLCTFPMLIRITLSIREPTVYHCKIVVDIIPSR